MKVITVNPYVGLRPFSFADRAFFHGRDRQVAELRHRVLEKRFTAVIGGSGGGKSSLVRAGLFSSLADESSGVGPWTWVELRPGRDPLMRLSRALAGLDNAMGPRKPAGDDPLSEARADRIYLLLCASSLGLLDALAHVRGGPLKSGGRLLLVVDQLEEIFRYDSPDRAADLDGSPAERREAATRFVQLLLEAAGRDLPLHIVVTMRSDYIGDCARFHGLPELVSRSQYLVPGFTRDELERAIRYPLKQIGGTIEHALVESLLNKVNDEPDGLPILQHALMRSFRRAAKRRAKSLRLTRRDFENIGGWANALSNHANEVLSQLEAQDLSLRLVTEQVFKALTDTDKEGRATRRPQTVEQLMRVLTPTPLSKDDGPLGLAQTLDQGGTSAPERYHGEGFLRDMLNAFRHRDNGFIAPRLPLELTSDTVVDIGHEALIRRWDRLNGNDGPGWLQEESRDGQRYRALIEFIPGPLSANHTPDWMRWWAERPRTSGWADRYGGRFFEVAAMLDASQRSLHGGDDGAVALRSLGFVTFDWLNDGLRRAAGVGGVWPRERSGWGFNGPLGTAFLVRGADLSPLLGEELVAVTNWYMVNPSGERVQGVMTLKPEETEIVFGHGPQEVRCPVACCLWTSGLHRLDATILRFVDPPPPYPLPLADGLPWPDSNDPVYILGFAGGRNLAFSFEDNRLIDHDGPPHGRPADPAVVRVHYQTITAPGSAGSPVLDRNWNVIALHHLGQRTARLNGKPGIYGRPCREGIWIHSIAKAVHNHMSRVPRGQAASLPDGDFRDVKDWIDKVHRQFADDRVFDLIDPEKLDSRYDLTDDHDALLEEEVRQDVRVAA